MDSVNPALSFHRGSLALDFVGTVGKRASRCEERLHSTRDFDAWLRAAGLVERGVRATNEELEAARELREAIARTGYAVVERARPSRADIATINKFAGGNALARPALDAKATAMRWLTEEPIRFALGRVAADAIDLFATRRERLVRCELPTCGSLLLSHSRGPARRWCTMETCGNVAKVAAHRARARSRAKREQRTE
jgi:predicted RNA-binding Zn ribbon-like protein